eukprot:5988496-Prymnesium_polylepis.2
MKVRPCLELRRQLGSPPRLDGRADGCARSVLRSSTSPTRPPASRRCLRLTTTRSCAPLALRLPDLCGPCRAAQRNRPSPWRPGARSRRIIRLSCSLCCLACRRSLYDKRLAAEVDGEDLGDEFKGYVLKVTGGQDKEGFSMKQGVLTADRVKLMMAKGAPSAPLSLPQSAAAESGLARRSASLGSSDAAIRGRAAAAAADRVAETGSVEGARMLQPLWLLWGVVLRFGGVAGAARREEARRDAFSMWGADASASGFAGLGSSCERLPRACSSALPKSSRADSWAHPRP